MQAASRCLAKSVLCTSGSLRTVSPQGPAVQANLHAHLQPGSVLTTCTGNGSMSRTPRPPLELITATEPFAEATVVSFSTIGAAVTVLLAAELCLAAVNCPEAMQMNNRSSTYVSVRHAGCAMVLNPAGIVAPEQSAAEVCCPICGAVTQHTAAPCSRSHTKYAKRFPGRHAGQRVGTHAE